MKLSISAVENKVPINAIDSIRSWNSFLTDRFHCDGSGGCVLPDLLPLPVWRTAALKPLGDAAAVLPLICGEGVVQGEGKGVRSDPFRVDLPVAVTLLVTGSRLYGAIAVH